MQHIARTHPEIANSCNKISGRHTAFSYLQKLHCSMQRKPISVRKRTQPLTLRTELLNDKKIHKNVTQHFSLTYIFSFQRWNSKKKILSKIHTNIPLMVIVKIPTIQKLHQIPPQNCFYKSIQLFQFNALCKAHVNMPNTKQSSKIQIDKKKIGFLFIFSGHKCWNTHFIAFHNKCNLLVFVISCILLCFSTQQQHSTATTEKWWLQNRDIHTEYNLTSSKIQHIFNFIIIPFSV